MSEKTTLGALVRLGHLELGDGYRTKRSEHGHPGYPILRVAEVLDGRIEPKLEDFISVAYRKNIGTKLSMPGDVILTTKGTVGRVAVMPSDGNEYAYSPQVCYFRPKANGPLLSEYLYYWFKTPEFWKQAAFLKGQTDMADYLSLSDIRSLHLTLPGHPVQKGIVEVLGALDEKIALNGRIINSCDLIRACRLDQFLKSAPEGEAHAPPLSSLAEFINGKAFTKNATGSGRMVVRIAELNSGPSGSTVYNDLEVPDKHLARAGDLLFAWSGSLTVHRWYRSEAIINQHIFKVIPRGDYPVWLLNDLLLAKLAKFKQIAADKATTMGHIQRKHLDECVHAPAPGSIPGLDAVLGPLWQRALLAEQESLKLSELRDILLPRLMSGEIKVRDAEKLVEEAV